MNLFNSNSECARYCLIHNPEIGFGISFNRIVYNVEFNESRSQPVSAQLANGSLIKIEVTQTGREDVAFDVRPFQEVTNAIEGIVEAIAATISKVSPTKAVVKFGVDVAIDSGKLTAMIVQGSSKANLEIVLEWEHSKNGEG